MGFFSKLNPQLFLIAFAVGIFYCYITFPEPKIIIQHPTPTNADKVVYQDENENCYKYFLDLVCSLNLLNENKN